MKYITLILLLVVSLSGCIIVPEHHGYYGYHGAYRYDNHDDYYRGRHYDHDRY